MAQPQAASTAGAPISPSPHTQLLARVDRLSSALASTTLSVSELIALNRSFDAAESIVSGAEAEAEDGSQADEPGHSRPSNAKSAAKAQPLDGGGPKDSEDVMARVGRLVSELQHRHDESRYIQNIAVQKATAAKQRISALETEVERLTHAHSTSLSELRLLATRMRRLERRVDGLTAWPPGGMSSPSASPGTPGSRYRPVSADAAVASPSGGGEEEIARWWRGVKDWWGDWGEVGRRVERRTGEDGRSREKEGAFSGKRSARGGREVDEETDWMDVRNGAYE